MENERKESNDFNDDSYMDYDLYEKTMNKSKSDSKRKTKKFKRAY